jgi:AraC family ethanolamine operon transcriptional activator
MNPSSPAGATLEILSLTLFDADALSDSVRSSRFEHLQLERCDFRADLKRIDVGQLTLDAGCYTRKVMARGDFPSDRVIVGCVLNSREAGNINGYRFGLNDVVVFPVGAELDCTLPAATNWCSVQLSGDALTQMGCAALTFDRVKVLPGNRPENVRLGRLLDRLTKARASAGDQAPEDCGLPPAFDEEMLLEQIRRTLNEHLGRRARGRRPSLRERMTLVRRFEQLVKNRIDTPVRIPELCAELGISQRTLEHVFKLEMGLTPKQFDHLLRLNAARQRLLRPSAEQETIAQVAEQYGINHLGRFSSAYLRQFGELPSDTVGASRHRLL